MIEKEILNSIDSLVVIKDKNNNILFYNKPLAQSIAMQSNKKQEFFYKDKCYKFTIKNIEINRTPYILETYQDITIYMNELTKYMYYVENLKKDQLTNLYNRHGINDVFNRIRSNNISASIILCDIDYFKSVNDSYGHNKGDNVLKCIGNILKQNIRSIDYVARYGGEEFLIILPFCDKKIAYDIATNIKTELNNSYFEFKNTKDNRTEKKRITMTFGISEYSDFKTLDEVIEEADSALYKGKNSGRNTICIYESKKSIKKKDD